ncbi:MAG: hypothetical protein ACYDCG_18275 [Candidatus Acidiferrales bacterium]
MPDKSTKELPSEQREGVARVLAPVCEQLVRIGGFEAPFDVLLSVTLTDANGKVWTASVAASDLTSVLSCANGTSD